MRKIGAKAKDGVLDLKNAYLHFQKRNSKKAKLFNNMRSFLESGEEGLSLVREMMEKVGLVPEKVAKNLKNRNERRVLLNWDEIEIKAPIYNPQKVIAIGLNYLDHCKESNIDPPKNPVIFAKFPSAIIGPNDPIVWPPQLTSQVDYEAELAVIVGKKAKGVEKKEALNFVAGYTIANDVSARDLQFGDGQWDRGKSLDTFCPLGPYLVTKDEIDNPHNLDIRCFLNGRVMQQSSTRNLIFDLPSLVSFLSEAFSLCPGDVICTGTPGGVGVSRRPPIFLQTGDVVVIEIENLGKLTNPVG
jgi:acylpyruvate hydrolase